MGVLDQLSPQQKQWAMIGIPVVAAFALISKIGRPANASNSEDATPSGTSGFTMPSTDAIGTGQLAEFESLVTSRLNDLSVKTEESGIYTGSLTDQLAGQISGLSQKVATLSAPPASPAETYPAPPPPAAAACSPPSWGISGEVTIAHLQAPGGGCWYISNWGGVHASGGAPFKGSCLEGGNKCRIGPGYENPPRYITSAANLGAGYQMWSNRGENYGFP